MWLAIVLLIFSLVAPAASASAANPLPTAKSEAVWSRADHPASDFAWAQLVEGGKPADGTTDRELVFALDLGDLWDEWAEITEMGELGSVTMVDRSPDHEVLVLDLVSSAFEIADLRFDDRRTASDLTSLATSIEAMDSVTRTAQAAEARQQSLTSADLSRLSKQLLLAAPRRANSADVSDLQARVGELGVELGGRLRELPRQVATVKVTVRSGWAPLLSRIEALRVEIDRRRSVLAVPSEAEAELLTQIRGLLIDLDGRRVTALTPFGVPLVTIDAYLAAEAFVPDSCTTVDWALLAGIGRVESVHGTLGGATVDADGYARPKIFGPLLDGGQTQRDHEEAVRAAERAARQVVADAIATQKAHHDQWQALVWGPDAEPDTSAEDPAAGADTGLPDAGVPEGSGDVVDGQEAEPHGNGFAVISDTDRGMLDANSDWDRAVGPMQFLPGTWRLWATDGDGDGITDPHDLHDATATAARYLCYLEGRFGADPQRYVMGYNELSTYVDAVLSHAQRFRSQPLPIRALGSN